MAISIKVENKFVRFLLLVMGCLMACLVLLSIFIVKGTEVVWINSLHNTFLDGFFYLITSLGNGLVIIPLLVIGLISRIRLALIAGISFPVLGMICSFIKSITDFPRPASLLDVSSLHYVPGVIVHSHNSFPSGHTATGFCLAVLIALYLQSRKVTFLLITIASLTGLSRIYLLQHILIDVTAGAFLGFSVGLGVWSMVRKIDLPWLDTPLIFPIGGKAVNGS